MNTEPLNSLDENGLRKYIEFLLWHYRVMDGFWFINVSDRFGLPAAEEINTKVWDKIGGMGAKAIVEKFGITEKGLEGFVKAQRLFPWSMISNFKIEQHGDEVILTVAACPSQVARKKRGLGEYSCKDMHKAEFEGFAKVIDGRICVECLFAPPDAHPDDLFCKWRFTIK
jgi:hypothetical protein